VYNLCVVGSMRRQLINLNNVVKQQTVDKPCCIKQEISAVNNEVYPEVCDIYKDIDGYSIVYNCRNCGQNSALSYTYCPYCKTKPNNNIYTYVDEKLYNIWKEDKVKAKAIIEERNLLRSGEESTILIYEDI